MNCISWDVGHLAWHEHRYWMERAQNKVLFPTLDEMYAYGAPMSTPSLHEMLDLWHQVTKAVDPYLDTLTTETLQRELLRDGQAIPTYVALDDWLGRQVKLSKKPDRCELARRYLRGYGPATPRDLAAWWDLPLTEAKAAWASLHDELIELDVEGQPVWLVRSELSALKKIDQQGHVVRLLPAFDTYLLGYHNRDFAVPPKYQNRVFHGGEIAPIILIDGGAAGTWRYESRGKRMRIKATPFSSFTSRVRDLIAEEADDVGRFFVLVADLSFAKDS